MGYDGINNHSIGIELVNPGYLKKASGGFVDAYGTFLTEHEVGPVVTAKHPKVGSGTFYWPVYPRAQLEALDAVFAEIVATFGLVFTIFATLKASPKSVAAAVGLYITAAYWFTASTSFANPAVTVARAFSDTFAGIRPIDMPWFIAMQFIGAAAAFAVCRWLLAEGGKVGEAG